MQHAKICALSDEAENISSDCTVEHFEMTEPFATLLDRNLQQIDDLVKIKKFPLLERFLIWNKTLVRQCELSWNQIELDALLIYDKLVQLGFCLQDDAVLVNEPKRESINV